MPALEGGGCGIATVEPGTRDTPFAVLCLLLAIDVLYSCSTLRTAMTDDDLTRTATGFARPPRERRVLPTLIVAQHPVEAVTGRCLQWRPGQSHALGRGGDAFGPHGLRDERLSRRHASLTWRDGLLTIEDLGSHNGTWVNGHRVRGARLLPGDVVAVGHILLVVQWAQEAFASRATPEGLIGHGVGLSQVCDRIDLAAPQTSPVLVQGETGTGKELVARTLHDWSGRPGPWVTVNCAALDPNLLMSELFGHARGAFSGAHADRAGLVAEAHGGTLFLDEIGEAPPPLQAALLRVIQDGEVRPVGGNRARKVRTRFVAATHRDLSAAVTAGTFREDLYARLSHWVIEVPPLRERREDIPLLASALASQVDGRTRRLTPALALTLMLQRWPRNVRELQGVMERLAVGQAENATLVESQDHVSLAPPPPAEARLTLTTAAGTRGARPGQAALATRFHILNGNMKALAQELGVGRNTLYRWFREAGLDPETLRRQGPGSAD